MSDAFSEFYIPPNQTYTPAPDTSQTFGTDTSYLYTPQSAQPGGSEFVAPTYSSTFNFAPTTSADYPASQQVTPSYNLADFPVSGASLADAQGYSPYPLGAGQLNLGGIPFPYARPSDLSQPSPTLTGATDTGAVTGAGPAQQPGVLDNILGKLSGSDIVKLLTGGLGGIMSYMGAQKAQQQAADAAAEYKNAATTAAQQFRDVAAPYLTAGAPQLSMALQGALGPAQMQQYQAGQARLAQAAARSGGIGAIQTAAAEQQMYQTALQSQQTMALQLLGQADPLLTSAINTELQGTQGGLDFELKYGAQAATALGQMMASLGNTVGRTQ